MVSKVSDTMSRKKKWQDLPFDQFSNIKNPKLRTEYRNKLNWTMKYIINPLYMYAIRHGFDDTDFVKDKNVSDMFYDLKKFYDSKKIEIVDMEDIIKESIRTK